MLAPTGGRAAGILGEEEGDYDEECGGLGIACDVCGECSSSDDEYDQDYSECDELNLEDAATNLAAFRQLVECNAVGDEDSSDDESSHDSIGSSSAASSFNLSAGEFNTFVANSSNKQRKEKGFVKPKKTVKTRGDVRRESQRDTRGDNAFSALAEPFVTPMRDTEEDGSPWSPTTPFSAQSGVSLADSMLQSQRDLMATLTAKAKAISPPLTFMGVHVPPGLSDAVLKKKASLDDAVLKKKARKAKRAAAKEEIEVIEHDDEVAVAAEVLVVADTAKGKGVGQVARAVKKIESRTFGTQTDLALPHRTMTIWTPHFPDVDAIVEECEEHAEKEDLERDLQGGSTATEFFLNIICPPQIEGIDSVEMESIDCVGLEDDSTTTPRSPVQNHLSLLMMPGRVEHDEHGNKTSFPQAKLQDQPDPMESSEKNKEAGQVRELIDEHSNVWKSWEHLWTTAMSMACGTHIAEDLSMCPAQLPSDDEGRKPSVTGVRKAASKVGGRRMRLRRGVTLDSGAAANVMPRRMLRKKMRVRASPGSKRGVHYLAANNARIKNEGEVDFQFQSDNHDFHSWVFQVAEVNKALCAVSYMVDHDYRVVFDRDKTTGVDTSFMLHKPSGKTIKLRREKNVWVIDVTVTEDDSADRGEDFARRG